MKVLRLTEASMSDIKMAEEAYNAAYGDDKWNVVNQFLRDSVGFKSTSIVLIALKNFGIEFLDKWVNAMRWDEMGRDDNEFILLLKFIDEVGDPNSPPIVDVDNFTKIYNVYSDGNVEKEYTKINPSKDSYDFWQDVVFSNDPSLELWSRGDDDFRKTLEYLHDCIEESYDSNTLSAIFLEQDGKGPAIRSVAEIEQVLSRNNILKSKNNKVSDQLKNLSDDQAKNLISGLLQRDGMIEYASDIISKAGQ